MRKIFVVSMIMVLVASWAMAADFQPTPTKIMGTDTIKYQFNGTDLSIPVNLTGSPALVKLAIFTKGKADQINAVKNGYLGWHFVDKIDTSIYISADNLFQPGNQTIVWNGKDQDGGTVAAGDYTYYLWGFNNSGARIKAIPISQGTQTNDEYLTVDDSGAKLAQPIWYTRRRSNGESTNTTTGVTTPASRTEFRWVLGSDPENESLGETCRVTLPSGNETSDYGAWVIDPADNTVFYGRTFNKTTVAGFARKFHWVPNDNGNEDTTFNVTFSPMNNYSGIEYDDTYLYFGECNYKEKVPRCYLHVIDFASTATGEYLGYIDQTSTFEQQDKYTQYLENAGAQVLMNNGWTQTAFFKEKGWMIGGCHCACLRVACEPRAWFDDPDTEGIRWVNGNGDYTLPGNLGVFDTQFDPSSTKPWVCASLGIQDFSNHGFGIDKHGIVEAGEYWGVISFHAVTPDGSGFGRFAFAGETQATGGRGGYTVLDDDTAYDGTYVQKNEGTATLGGTFWIGRDSFKGTITDKDVAVEADAPSAFTVAQNTPNPFNPTTTINFTLAKAGNVTVDVFNVAGQKVATLANGYRNAGAQSLVWDASSQAAGVYFYTVKSGNLSKTMKMTLVK